MREMELHSTVKSSCPTCHGSAVWGGENEACRTCAPVDPSRIRFVLERLTPKQMKFLRFGVQTLANQPVTEAEWEECGRLVQLFVEDDDAVIEGYDVLIPATCHWFGGAQMGFGGGTPDRYFINYTPLGLALRECLTHGAGACLETDRVKPSEEQPKLRVVTA